MKSDHDAKIYVAGHDGMVGSAIIRKLKMKGYDNIFFKHWTELDLRCQHEVDAFFKEQRPEHVFLAAAKVGGIQANNTYKAEFIYDNLMIAANVIHAAYKYGVKKLLNLGSSCIYPKLAPQPMKEEHLLTGELEPTNEPYALAKIAAIKLCTSYNFQYGTNFLSVMPTNLFGSNDNYNLETSHVLPAMIRKMILGKALREKNFDFIRKDFNRYKVGFGLDEKIEMNDNDSIAMALDQIGITGDHVNIWGSGNVRREFLHVDDVADACVFFIENHTWKTMGDFVNLGTGEDNSLKNIAYLIKEKTGYQGELRFDTSKPEGTPRKLLDVSKASSLGWNYSIAIDKGIEMVIEEYYYHVN
jgi:GDP-L-fucose synthase